MKAKLKRILAWDQRTEPEKVTFRRFRYPESPVYRASRFGSLESAAVRAPTITALCPMNSGWIANSTRS